MAVLKRSWVKPGYYPLGDVSALKWENTQEFHDQYLKLKHEVNQAVKQSEQQITAINNDVANNQLTLEKQLYQWTDADFESFCMFKATDDTKRRFKALIIRDKMTGLLQRLKQYQAVLQQESEEAMKGGDRARRMIEQLNTPSVFVTSGYTQLSSWDQLKFISKSQFDSSEGTKIGINIDAVLNNIVNSSASSDDGKGSSEPRKEPTNGQ